MNLDGNMAMLHTTIICQSVMIWISESRDLLCFPWHDPQVIADGASKTTSVEPHGVCVEGHPPARLCSWWEEPWKTLENHIWKKYSGLFLFILEVSGWRSGQTEQLHKPSSLSFSPNCWRKRDLHESYLRIFTGYLLPCSLWVHLKPGLWKESSRGARSRVLRSKWLKQVADWTTWVARRISALIPPIRLLCTWEINCCLFPTDFTGCHQHNAEDLVKGHMGQITDTITKAPCELCHCRSNAPWLQYFHAFVFLQEVSVAVVV